jgi:hypothetical protein
MLKEAVVTKFMVSLWYMPSGREEIHAKNQNMSVPWPGLEMGNSRIQAKSVTTWAYLLTRSSEQMQRISVKSLPLCKQFLTSWKLITLFPRGDAMSKILTSQIFIPLKWLYF